MERVAPAETFQAHPHSARRAMRFNRLTHIFRTRRMEAARRGQQRRYQELVSLKDVDENLPHRIKRRRTSVRSSVNGHFSALRRGLKTIDHSELNCDSSSRTASRMRRLMRLRMTALPSARGVVNPTRGP